MGAATAHGRARAQTETGQLQQAAAALKPLNRESGGTCARTAAYVSLHRVLSRILREASKQTQSQPWVFIYLRYYLQRRYELRHTNAHLFHRKKRLKVVRTDPSIFHRQHNFR